MNMIVNLCILRKIGRVLLGFLAVCMVCLSTDAAAQQTGARPKYLQELLRYLSQRTGDVFALELVAIGDDAPKMPLPNVDFNIINSYTSPEKLLAAFFPEFGIKRSPTNSNLWFVFHNHLSEYPEYGLTRQLKAFQFKGNLQGLFAQISRSVPSIKFLRPVLQPDINQRTAMFGELKLEISLKETDVRHALSACLDLHATRGIAWVAITRIKDGVQEIDVTYTRDAVFSEVK
jgi:hypothetical protein